MEVEGPGTAGLGSSAVDDDDIVWSDPAENVWRELKL